MGREPERLTIRFEPRSESGVLFKELMNEFFLESERLSEDLVGRLRTIIAFAGPLVEGRQFEIGPQTGGLPARLTGLSWYYPGRGSIGVELLVSGQLKRGSDIEAGELTQGQHRLVDSISVSVEKLAWERLRANLELPTTVISPEVFISYRSSKEAFAESVALRLGREGIVPFFDKWDVKAGDSIPGKIEEAFGRSTACVIVLSADFTQGKWATTEMEIAITKRIQEGYKVIPILYEDCETPELFKPLRHVDFSNHDPQTFESKFAELIDAIYSLELNPFRT